MPFDTNAYHAGDGSATFDLGEVPKPPHWPTADSVRLGASYDFPLSRYHFLALEFDYEVGDRMKAERFVEL